MQDPGDQTATRDSRPPMLARIQAASPNLSAGSIGVSGKENKRKAKGWEAGQQGRASLPSPPSAVQGAA